MSDGVTRATGHLRFDGRTVVVTGAGSGLGRAYALEFARRGGSVVVNARDTAAAGSVVEEITTAGGHAIASGDSVLDGARIIDTAVAAFGRVDVLVNNAGIIRDRSFARLTDEDWQAVCDVHLSGAWRTTQAAWQHMLKAHYGRVLFTSSAAGLYGNFGQASYSAAKLGLVGLMRTLAREGALKNIYSNAIAPLAATRSTKAVMSADLAGKLRPEQVVPLVVVLAHDSCAENGALFEAGGGWFARLRWERSHGLRFGNGRIPDAEHLAARWGEVVDFSSHAEHPDAIDDSLHRALGAVS